MSDAFREPTPEEIRLATLQFMGQNLGDLKQLDNHIVSKNQTLQGLNLNAEGILRGLPNNNLRMPRHNTVAAPGPAVNHVTTSNSIPPPVQISNVISNEKSNEIADSLKKIANVLENIDSNLKDALYFFKNDSK